MMFTKRSSTEFSRDLVTAVIVYLTLGCLGGLPLVVATLCCAALVASFGAILRKLGVPAWCRVLCGAGLGFAVCCAFSCTPLFMAAGIAVGAVLSNY